MSIFAHFSTNPASDFFGRSRPAEEYNDYTYPTSRQRCSIHRISAEPTRIPPFLRPAWPVPAFRCGIGSEKATAREAAPAAPDMGGMY